MYINLITPRQLYIEYMKTGKQNERKIIANGLKYIFQIMTTNHIESHYLIGKTTIQKKK